jgi:tetratricopeptide (TPR) repeat protein
MKIKLIKNMTKIGLGARTRSYLEKAKKKAVYLSVMGGVLDSVNEKSSVIEQNAILSNNYSMIAYVLGIGIIVLSVFIVRLMVKYYTNVNYNAGLDAGVELGKEELLSEQEEAETEADAEAGEELTEEEKSDIDYDMAIEDIDKYTESLSDEDSDQPVIQNINKFVTGYKFLKPPDVAVLSITKRFDEYEVSIALPEKRKGASKISEFIPFDEKTRKEIQDEFDATAQLNNSMVGMPNMGGMGPIITSRLDGLGKRISSTFIPDIVIKNLKEIKDPIIIESNDGEILWEAIHDGKNFIALEHPIGRVLKTKEEARVNEFERGEKLRFLMICNPTGDLESTEREVNYIESILKQRVIIEKIMKENATKTNILEALSCGKFDVIHYAGHADSESEGEAALLTADGKLFSSEIKNAIAGRPYVYLNACGSGRESMDESKDTSKVSDTEGLASAFILGGAIGFMGAFWPVPDKTAAEFSVRFYEGLIENLKVGEACRQARLEILKQNQSDITWAAFLQYGDPVQRLREKKSESEKVSETDEDLDEDADIEVVDEDEYEKSLEDAEGEEGAETEDQEPEEKGKELTEEERQEQYQGWIVGGLEHMKNKKYEDAITAFDSAIGLDPERYNAWHLTANALRELRRYNEALECYDKALERDGTVDEIWYDKALALGGVGRFDEAMDCKFTSESLKVGRIKEWLKKANELMAHGGIRDAIKIYKRILKENEKYPLAWYLMGFAYAELKEYEKALQYYENSLRYARNFSLGYHKKAEVLFRLGQKDNALENIEKAIELNPINEDGLILKSDILIDMKRFKPALKVINHVLVLNKNNGEAVLRKAEILRQYNKKKEALESYDKVIKLDPENQDGWYWRGTLMDELGMDESEVLECYKKLLDMEITNPDILLGVGSSLVQKEGLLDLKLKWYNKMILTNPNDPYAWFNKGTTLEGMKRTDEAFDAFLKVVEIESNNKAALMKLAVHYRDIGDDERSLEFYSKLAEIDPDDRDVILNQAQIYSSIGKFYEALTGFKKLYKTSPTDIDLLVSMLEIYSKLDQKKNEMLLLKKLQALEPDNIKHQLAYLSLLHNYKNYPEIINLTEKLIEKVPDNYEVLMIRGEALSSMNKLDQALDCWNKVIELKAKTKTTPEPKPGSNEQSDHDTTSPSGYNGGD